MGGVATSTGDATQSMDGLNQSTMWSMQGMMGLSSVVRLGITDYERLQLTHVRLESSQLAVTKAQEAYTAAVKAHGAASQQAIDAQDKLQVATDRLNYYQERSNLNWVMMATQIPMALASITQLTGGLGSLGGALSGAGESIGGLVAAMGPIGIAIIAIVAAIAILYEAWTNDWGGIREKVGAAADYIKGALAQIGKDLSGFGDAVKNAIGGAVDWLKSNWQDVLVTVLTGPVGLAYEAWKNNWGGFRDIVTNAVTAVGNALNGMKDAVVKPVQDAWTSTLDTTTKAWDQIKGKVNEQMPLIGGLIQTGMDLIHGNWQKAWQDISALPGQLLEQMEKDVGTIFDDVKTAIKGFTDAFQAAEDLLKPIVDAISKAIVDFLTAVEKAFTDFYDWLVGASPWVDLWNAILAIANKMVVQLLSDLQSKFFDVMAAAFTKATQLVQDIWNRSWQAIQTIFTTITTAIQSALASWFNLMQNNFMEAIQLLNNLWTTGWQAIQITFTNISGQIQNAWQSFLTMMKTAMDTFWTAIEGATTTAFNMLEAAFTAAMNTIEAILNSAISAMQGFWSGFMAFMQGAVATFEATISGAQTFLGGVLSAMVAATSAACSTIAGLIAAAWQSVTTSTQQMSDSMTKHSIWPDMLAEMEAQTKASMANIIGAFTGGFATIVPAVPSATAMTAGLATFAQQLPAGQQPISLTIPITVTLDGQTISKQVERRIVERANFQTRKVA
jgi:phage-related protein